MRITEITYAELKNLGNFQHRKLEVTAMVVEGDNPQEVLTKLHDWCQKEFELLRNRTVYDEDVHLPF